MLVFVLIVQIVVATESGMVDQPDREAGWFKSEEDCTAIVRAIEEVSGDGVAYFAHCKAARMIVVPAPENGPGG